MTKREIKFRGLRTDGKGWVHGDLAKFWDNSPCIMERCYFGTRDFLNEDEDGNPILEDEIALGGFISVTPQSVGQFTGLKDRNGIEIYEGDVVEYDHYSGIVYYSDSAMFCTRTIASKHYEQGSSKKLAAWFYSGLKGVVIVGNIHQNLELFTHNTQ